jgi:nicotinamidase/pyrazinamidase
MNYDRATALIVVDVQNDFADPAGGLYVTGAEEIVDVINAEIRRASIAGALVVYTQDWHPAETPHFEQFGGPWPVHCVRDTWGAELHPALEVTGERVRKGTGGEDGYSGFSMRDPVSGETSETALPALLRERDIAGVAIVGLATDVCVRATALDAIDRGLVTHVLRDATRGVDLQPGDTERALAEMASAGVLVE